MNTIIPKKSQDLLNNLKNILAISSELLNNFSDEDVMSTLQKRNDLLNSIENSISNYAESDSKLDNETKTIVNRIISIDNSIMKKIKERMDQIKTEINNLYTTSRAANAYSVYRSNKTRLMINANT
jgi:hypothetical protein